MAYNPNNPNGQGTMANSSPVTIASDQSSIPVTMGDNGILDTFGKLQMAGSFNEIDVQFYRDIPQNTVSLTIANGGTATTTGGLGTGAAQFATSTAANGSIIGTTVDNVTYRSGGEVYSMMTAAFLDGGSSGNIQRIGLFDSTNGFFIGYEGSTFSVSVINGGTVSTTFKGAFSTDQLTGAVGSKFTRAGSPEAIDLTKLNIFRIRFGWLGAAPIRFEVVAPDGNWVLFHVIRQPNLSSFPSISNVDLPMKIDLTKTLGATNIRVNTACWGAGTTYINPDNGSSYTLPLAAQSTVSFNINGTNTLTIRYANTVTGLVAIESTVDGRNWVIHPNILKVAAGGGLDTILGTSSTPTSGDSFRMTTSGYRGIRARVETVLSAPLTIYSNGDIGTSVVQILGNGPAPHAFGYTQVHKDGAYTTAQTTTILWTPSAGKKFAVTDITITTGGTTAGIVVLYDAAAATASSAGVTPAVFRGEFAPSNTSRPGVVKNYIFPYISTTNDNRLFITASPAMTVYVQVNGYEL